MTGYLEKLRLKANTWTANVKSTVFKSRSDSPEKPNSKDWENEEMKPKGNVEKARVQMCGERVKFQSLYFTGPEEEGQVQSNQPKKDETEKSRQKASKPKTTESKSRSKHQNASKSKTTDEFKSRAKPQKAASKKTDESRTRPKAQKETSKKTDGTRSRSSSRPKRKDIQTRQEHSKSEPPTLKGRGAAAIGWGTLQMKTLHIAVLKKLPTKKASSA